MRFAETDISFDEGSRNTILDYTVKIQQLREEDRILPYGELGNYSITGVEIYFARHKMKYMYIYYLPSGDKWVKSLGTYRLESNALLCRSLCCRIVGQFLNPARNRTRSHGHAGDPVSLFDQHL